ncbi:checkpoint clamp complex protein Hus1 [Schizosaccharomyces japonicus yFS275]|uniref:Checkpoint protein n=1 Tax=Schizosaccharomyces japonicus (strain yFS275 / FY16936) TaxID=402676 RepID=B6K345_SCHJY|nr:checkpoint clamp complex protein Hus1 [Schizosaccharomyces japonicus yFS275]EEB07902.2 checkpoint clamp complex protein Hus1 [Schizosaccharomyces japonicus yFS275]
MSCAGFLQSLACFFSGPMRFKTRISNLPTLSRLAQSLDRIGKFCWIRLMPETVNFVVIPEFKTTQVWAVVEIETVFEDYIVQSNAENVINLEVPTANLYKALRSATNAAHATLRLTKQNNQAILSLSTTWSGRAFGSNIVTHNIAVKVLSHNYVSLVKEPTVPEPNCHIFLPPLNVMKAVVDRYRSMSDRIIFSANMAGELELAICTPAAKIKTRWSNLQNPELDPSQVQDVSQHPSQMREPHEFVEMRLDSREFSNILLVSNVSRKVIACLCEGHALVLYVYITDPEDEHTAVLTYYMSTFLD